MEFERRNWNANGNGNGNGIIYGGSYGMNNGHREALEEREWDDSPKMTSLKICHPVSSSSSSSSSSSPSRYIEHHVTKLDTLAGVAIRYGVEVSDIKRLNGLVTDLQMFARKTLYIPLPGRHPPSPCLSNGDATGQNSSDHSPARRKRSDLLESFQSLKTPPNSKISPAMSSLQGYYGLGGRRNSSIGCEMAVYSTGYQEDDDTFTTPSQSFMNPPLSHHRRSRSLANGFKTEEDDQPTTNIDVGPDPSKWIEKLTWRRQKSEADFTRTPEKLLKEENGSGSWFSAITGKGLALRSKASSRTNLASEGESGGMNGFPVTLVDSIVAADSSSGVRKSSSTSNLQDQEGNNGSSSSIWSTSKWDLQAALAKPIFDGLPKPISGRKSKAALD